MQDRKQAEIAREMDEAHAMSIESVEAGLDDDLGDELLGLIFAACHPAISPEARAALTLRLVGGLTARETARAFLSNGAAIAARIPPPYPPTHTAGRAYEVPSRRAVGRRPRAADDGVLGR